MPTPTPITFEPLPPRPINSPGIRDLSAALDDVAAQLRATPGEWARIDTKQTKGAATARAQQIRTGSLRAFRPHGTFEAAARTVDGEHRVYARYVGQAAE